MTAVFRRARWLAVAALAVPLAAVWAAAPPRLPVESRAEALLRALVKEDFCRAREDFSPALKSALSEKEMRDGWVAVKARMGRFQGQQGRRTVVVGGSRVVLIGCRFEKMALELQLKFDRDGKVGSFLLTVPRPTDVPPPPYARRESFREEPVVVGQGGRWPLPGTLSVPHGKGPFPAVVLVQGSGELDRDETIGPNKVFRDLAWGLASRGVAVLRYEKRTYRYPAGANKDAVAPTLEEEVTDDALAAVAVLRKQPSVDAKRVFVVGHSLGAMSAPQIGARDPGLAGLVLLAGNSRRLEDVIAEQIPYLLSLKGQLTAADREVIAELRKQVPRVKGPLPLSTPAKDLPQGWSARYWRSIKAYDQVATAAKLKMPMLVLQGERDYQITMTDFAGWKKGLAGRTGVTFRSYPGLNHLFLAGKGRPSPDEYFRPGQHVAQEVVEDVAAWIKGR